MKKLKEYNHCLTCKWEPEWFAHADYFNACPHCNTHIVGICKKIALIVPVLGQPASWPDALAYGYTWVEKRDGRVFRYDKMHPSVVSDCPAYEAGQPLPQAEV